MATIQMHEEFVADVSRRIVELEKNIENLRSVRQFHADEIERLRSIAVSNGVPNRQIGSPPFEVPGGLTRHDAAKAVLEHLGRPAKVSEITEVLGRFGYGAESTPRIFHNSVFTAVSRRNDMFVKMAPGVWGLVGRDKPPTEEDATE